MPSPRDAKSLALASMSSASFVFAPAQRSEHELPRSERCDVSVASATASTCSISDAATESSPANMCTPARVLRVSGRIGERAGIVGDLDLARRQRVPAVVVPDERGGSAGEPGPSQAFFGGNASPAERVQRLLEDRGPRRGAVDDEAWPGRRAGGPRRAGIRPDAARRAQRAQRREHLDPCASRPANKAAVIASR